MGLRDRIKAQQEQQNSPAPIPAGAPLLSIRDKIRNFGVNRPEEAPVASPPAVAPSVQLAPVGQPTAAPAPLAPPAAPSVSEIEPKRGRPRKVETPAAPTAPVPSGFTLCVDCAPVGQQVTLLSDLVAPLARRIEAENKVSHYRLIDYKAGGLLADALRKRLAAEPVSGVVVTTKSTFEGRETLSVLEEFAAAKFYGVSS